jgi:hypothetical protein
MDVSIDLYGRQVNVDAQQLNLEKIQSEIKQEQEEYLAKCGGFPSFGVIFRIDDQLFRVTYVNKGKKRISATWFDDKSKPFSGLPEIESSCSIYGKIYKVTFLNESNKRITIEPIS